MFHSAFESTRLSFTVTHIAVVDVVVNFREMQNREIAGGEAADDEQSGNSINLRMM